jgi:hypothetical protein
VAAIMTWGSAPMALLADTLVVALCGLAATYAGRGALLRWTPWFTGSALLGASLLATLNVALWPLAAGLAFIAAGVVSRPGNRPRLASRIGIVAVCAVLNATFLWLLMFSEHRPVSRAEFESKHLRMHALLSDVPLHDVWAAHLRGGPEGLTMRDARWLLIEGFSRHPNTAFVAVASIREVLSALFGWDDDACHYPAASFVHRLSESDSSRSLTPPGDSMFVYTFEYEALIEIRNCTVHALVGMALEPTVDGYVMYWAFYVKPVGPLTRFYMALIQLFRTTIIYPPLIEGVEREWTERASASVVRAGDVGSSLMVLNR